MRKYILEVTVFLSGACVMALELVGSRLFAPYLGTSLFVWTSLIGVILGCLSLGYLLGGWLSDRKPEPRILSAIILLSAAATAGIALVGDPVLFMIQALSEIFAQALFWRRFFCLASPASSWEWFRRLRSG